jgi:HlyD family secretion protein
MDEVDAARLRPGLPARVTVDSHRGEEFPGKVVRVASYVLDVEEQNRTVEIEVELEDEAFAATLLPGTSADAEVVLESREDVLRVPSSCLFEGTRVLVLEDGKLREVEVEVGLRNWEWVEIAAGLEAGDRVVSSLDRAEIRAGAEAVAAGDRTGDPGP